MAYKICPFMSDENSNVRCKENCALYSCGKCVFVEIADNLYISTTPKKDTNPTEKTQ